MLRISGRAALLLSIFMLWFAGCSTSGNATTEEAAEAFYNLGNAYTELGRNQDAAAAYIRARQLNPGLMSAGFNLARVYIILEQYDRSLEQLDVLLEADPVNRRVLETKAWVYHLQQKNSAALEIYNGILDRFDGSRNSLYNSAVLLSEEEDYPEALKRFRKLYELYPDEESAVFEIAFLEAQLENYEQASLWLEKRLDDAPEDTPALELSGDVFAERMLYADAVEMYREIASIAEEGDAGDVSPDTLGRVYFKIAEILLRYMEDTEGGIAALEMSAETGWESRDDFNRLLDESASWYSDVFEIIGDKEKAGNAEAVPAGD